MSLLTLEGVTRTVERPDEEPLTILHGIDLEIDSGDRISVVGRSGSGKSTLLNILGLLDAPSTGRIAIHDRDVRTLSSAHRDRLRGSEIGFIFQQFNLLAGRTALENVMTPLLYAHGRASGVASRSRERCSNASASATGSTRSPTGSRAVSNNVSRSPALSFAVRG